MSSDTDAQAIFKKAIEQEGKYKWLEAAKLYEELPSSKPATSSLAAETWERIGFCYELASRQSEDLKGFEKLRQLSVNAYKKATKLFEREDNLKNQGKSAQCNAVADFVGSWLAPNPSEKRKMLDDCLEWGRKSLEAYEKVDDKLNYGKMCNDLLLCLLERLYISSDWKEMNNVAQEGINFATKALEVLSKLGDKSELLRAYFTVSLQSWYAANISEEENKRKDLIQKSLSYSENALKLSKEVDNPCFAAMSNWAAAVSNLYFTENIGSALEYAKEMLKQGTIAKDNYLRGVASYVLAFVTDWTVLREADPERKKQGHEKIIKYAKDAIGYLQSVSQDYFIAETYLFYAESYSSLASDAEASSEERRVILEKAVEIGRRGLDYAARSGSPDAMGSTFHALSKALHFYSNFEAGKDQKVKLLKEALVHRKEYNETVQKAFPSNDWISGVGKNYEGLIKLELARLETDNDKKRDLLETAVLDMEDGVRRCRKSILSNPAPSLVVAVGRFEDGFGEVLNELYKLTEDNKVLSRAIEVYEDASKDFKKANLSSRAAESYWKMARNQDRLGEHQEAAKNFENAFAEYKAASQRTPNFADFYLDHATYMEAWSEIERAKFAHKKEEYTIAMKHYEKVSSLLKPSKFWSYLFSNFLAWSLLEQAEDLSRKESVTESTETFNKAAELFEVAKNTIEEEIDKIQYQDEKEKAIELGKASVRRKDYCLARANLEEARICDRRGEYAESAKKYESAAIIFERILETVTTPTEQEEIKPIAFMCRAWQKMKMADVRVSPKLYHEASMLFLEAKEHSTKDKTILLASGNGSFCEALEHGTIFEATREKEDFSRVKQHLESAANYYLKAGFDNASLWTNATEILFDAYNYMINAEIEVDPDKKMKTYLLAEKCLERSAEFYETAGYVGKRDEVLKTLRKVKEKREFVLSLGELLAVPNEASSTSIIPAPAMTAEEPVGFSKFEGALVQASLTAYKTEAAVCENWDLGIQLVNVGKNPALLIRVEGIIPNGLELVEEPEIYRVEDSSLSMKGRRLDPLKTEEFRLVFKSSDKGAFEIKPRIFYVDETGHQMSCEPEPVTINISQTILPDHVTTGCGDLDNLLLGGIPEGYTVVLTSPSCDERDLLIQRFLETGAKKGETTFYVTLDPGSIKALVEDFQSNFRLFICNPQADEIVKSLPNVVKLKGVENLTDISIALTSAFRRLDTSVAGPRRVCIEIISDALLQHHAVTTRRWLTSIVPELRSRGFTTLAVMNPQMHPSEEVQAILDLFEGEISVYEKETRKGLQRFVKIKKMYNQRYLESELSLKKERLKC